MQINLVRFDQPQNMHRNICSVRFAISGRGYVCDGTIQSKLPLITYISDLKNEAPSFCVLQDRDRESSQIAQNAAIIRMFLCATLYYKSISSTVFGEKCITNNKDNSNNNNNEHCDKQLSLNLGLTISAERTLFTEEEDDDDDDDTPPTSIELASLWPQLVFDAQFPTSRSWHTLENYIYIYIC